MAAKNDLLIIDIKTEKQIGSFRTLEEFEKTMKIIYDVQEVIFS